MVPNVKIAVVEHDQLTRDFIVNVMMYSVNREIAAFEDGEGLDAYLRAGGNLDLVLADTQLPAISGLDLLKAVKKEFPSLVFVLMSADPADEAPAAKLGADAFLAKPFTIQDLFDIIQLFVVCK